MVSNTRDKYNDKSLNFLLVSHLNVANSTCASLIYG